MPKLKAFPFWLLSHGTEKRNKIPKILRDSNSLAIRELKTIKRDKKTGKYQRR